MPRNYTTLNAIQDVCIDVHKYVMLGQGFSLINSVIINTGGIFNNLGLYL